MKIGAEMGINIVWQYIVFKYNENHIEKAMKMAKDIGVTFELNISARWDQPYDPYKPLNSKYVKEHGSRQTELFS